MNLRDYTAKIFEISIVVIALILFYITKTFDIGTWYNITVGIIAVLIVLLLVVVYYDLTHNNLKNKKIGRKGQEEITGFVLVVVLVAVILVVFLGITLRGDKSNSQESLDVSHFLDSMMEYTTDCALQYEPAYSELDELFSECYSNSDKKCTSGKGICEQAKNISLEILDASWPTGANRPVKGIVFNSDYEINNSVIANVIKIERGNCSSSVIGAEHFSANLPGNIVTSLKICS